MRQSNLTKHGQYLFQCCSHTAKQSFIVRLVGPWFAIVGVALLFGGCTPVGKGSISLGVSLPIEVRDKVKRVVVTVNHPAIANALGTNLRKIGPHWKLWLNDVPAGLCDVSVQAFTEESGEAPAYQNTVTGVRVSQQHAVSVFVFLQETQSLPPDHRPFLENITASSIGVAPGEAIDLRVKARFPALASTIRHQWSATGGTFSRDTDFTTTWKATKAGSYAIHMKVETIIGGTAGASLFVEVKEDFRTGGSPLLETSFNNWPVIKQVTSESKQVKPLSTVVLKVESQDVDNDALHHTWDSSCGGSFSSLSPTTFQFTVPGTIPSSGTCTLTVQAQDRLGGTHQKSVVLLIAGAPVNQPPVLTKISQSLKIVPPGGKVKFQVESNDPEGLGLTYSWAEVDGANGVLGQPQTDGSNSEIEWTAAKGKCSGTIRVTVKDKGEPSSSTTHDFRVRCLAIQVASGARHSCAILADGSLQCWGDNTEGQLGTGDATNHKKPVALSLKGITVQQMSLGDSHSCAVLSNSKLFCWGSNQHGQLGQSQKETILKPTEVTLPSGVTVRQVSAGRHHTCAILSDDSLQCWGGNDNGQLGNGTTQATHKLQRVSLGEGNIAKDVQAGPNHTCAILTDGNMKCWGFGLYGQLGDGQTQSSQVPVDVELDGDKVTNVALGATHTCAIFSDESLRCWGNNAMGQLGNGTLVNSGKPVVIFPSDNKLQPKLVQSGSHWTCAHLSDNSVQCWGLNEYGQLGNGTNVPSKSPQVVKLDNLTSVSLAAGDAHVCVIYNKGRIACWGKNRSGQLGNDATTDSNVPVDVFGYK